MVRALDAGCGSGSKDPKRSRRGDAESYCRGITTYKAIVIH